MIGGFCYACDLLKNSISHLPLRLDPHIRFALGSVAHVLFGAARCSADYKPGFCSDIFEINRNLVRDCDCKEFIIMYLHFYLNENGDRVYTLKVSPDTTAFILLLWRHTLTYV